MVEAAASTTCGHEKASDAGAGDWHRQLKDSPSGIDGVAALLRLSGADRMQFEQLLHRYPFRATPYYLSLIDWSNAEKDPIRLQCIPDVRELEGSDICVSDPFAELSNCPAKRLIQRYRNRVVLIATSQCAVKCRHCTRKNTIGNYDGRPLSAELRPAIEHISRDRSIREVIVSGGDPLMLDDSLLDRLLGELRAIDHVRVLRIGTRMPAVLPARIDVALCMMLASHRPMWVNTHFNHPRELTPDALAACELLLRHGIPVANQTVLLRGVNDDAGTMAELFTGLHEHMIRPYYVFQCDPIAGAAHFRVSTSTAIAVSQEVRKRISGMAMPAFVKDIPGEAGKMPL